MIKGSIGKQLEYIRQQTVALLPSDISRRNRGKQITLILASAHKVGSTWVYRMLRDLGLFVVWPVPKIYRANKSNIGLLDLHAAEVRDYLRKQGGCRMFKSHSLPPTWEPPSNVRFLTVVRDPRDVVVSNIFYLANLEPHLGGWPELNQMTSAERISYYLEKGKFDMELMSAWGLHANAIRLRYEDLLADAASRFFEIVVELGIDVDEDLCREIAKKNSFGKLTSGRKPGEENQQSFFRKGIAGDWVNYFGPEEIACFKETQQGLWNRLLIDLGYEQDDDW